MIQVICNICTGPIRNEETFLVISYPNASPYVPNKHVHEACSKVDPPSIVSMIGHNGAWIAVQIMCESWRPIWT
jgi:hypothetical protein